MLLQNTPRFFRHITIYDSSDFAPPEPSVERFYCQQVHQDVSFSDHADDAPWGGFYEYRRGQQDVGDLPVECPHGPPLLELIKHHKGSCLMAIAPLVRVVRKNAIIQIQYR
jgi:hypothetical protein